MKALNLIRRCYRAIISMETINSTIDLRLKMAWYQNNSTTSNDALVATDKNYDDELIVSFTTYSKRIHDVHLVIESIGSQTCRPNRLILWLDEEEFNIDTIPEVLRLQIKRGLEIRFCQNIKSYKKLIPTIKAFPNANIITIDDDILYPFDMIELLVKEHKVHPNVVIGHRVHKITFDSKNEVAPYNNWEYEIDDANISNLIFPVGVGGIFYPKTVFSDAFQNSELFLKLAPSADDVWFKIMALVNGIPSKKVDDPRDFSSRFLLLPEGQDIGLMQENVEKGANDKQIKDTINYFEGYDYLK
jgi:hypothetical protein